MNITAHAAALALAPMSLVTLAVKRGAHPRRGHARHAETPFRARSEQSSRQVMGEIEDAGTVPFTNLVMALSTVSFAELEATGYDGNDPWTAALGLTDRGFNGPFGDVDPFHIASGARHGRQVVLRRAQPGAYWGLPIGARRTEHELLVRAAFPSFELTGTDGVVTASASAPRAVRRTIAGLAPSCVWSSLRASAGEDGIVFTRPAELQVLGGYAYDLWLGELLADAISAHSLEREQIGVAYELPRVGARRDSHPLRGRIALAI